MSESDMLRDSEVLSCLSRHCEQSSTAVTGIDGHARLIEWFRRWRRPIRHWIASNEAVPASEVDDLTQEVFLRLLRYCNDVPVTSPQSYLFRVATNVVLEWRERCRIRLPHDDTGLEEIPLDAQHEPENLLEQTRASEYLREAIDELPARQREILLMHMEDALTYKQIAARRGLTYRIVLRDLTRAYGTLRRSVQMEDL